MEHASIAAFSKLTLRLLQFGAPMDLVKRTHEAALDEVRHASLCFAVANAFSGRRWSAGEIPELGSTKQRNARPRLAELTALAVNSLRDGAFAEGIAAEVAKEAASLAVDDELRSMLQQISEDERVHSSLGWDVLKWCLLQGADEHEVIRVAHALRGNETALPSIPGVSERVLREHGFLPQEQLLRLREDVVAQTIDRVSSLSRRHAA